MCMVTEATHAVGVAGVDAGLGEHVVDDGWMTHVGSTGPPWARVGGMRVTTDKTVNRSLAVVTKSGMDETYNQMAPWPVQVVPSPLRRRLKNIGDVGDGGEMARKTRACR